MCSLEIASSTPRTSLPSSDGTSSPAAPGGPQLAGDPDHLGPDGDVLALRTLEDPLGRELIGPKRVPKLPGEELRPEAALALRRREDGLPKVRLEPRQRVMGGADRRPEAWQECGDVAVGPGCGLGFAEGVVGQLAHPGELLERRFGVQARDRSSAVTDELARARHR